MAQGDITITVIGNLTGDPELRYTHQGKAVTNFTVASTPRYMDKQANEWKDGDAVFLRCNVWAPTAENVAESLSQGDRVIVSGRLKQRSYETKDGQKRTVYEVEADEVGASMKFRSVKITKSERTRSTASPASGNDYPWPSDPAPASSQWTDEPPF